MTGYRTKKHNRASSVFKAIMMFLTVAMMMLVALKFYLDKKHMEELRRQCTESVTGICVEVTYKDKTRTEHKKRRHGSKSYKVQKNYREYTSFITYTVDGKEYKISSTHEDSPYPKEGDNISIYYDPDDPSVSYIP